MMCENAPPEWQIVPEENIKTLSKKICPMLHIADPWPAEDGRESCWPSHRPRRRVRPNPFRRSQNSGLPSETIREIFVAVAAECSVPANMLGKSGRHTVNRLFTHLNAAFALRGADTRKLKGLAAGTGHLAANLVRLKRLFSLWPPPASTGHAAKAVDAAAHIQRQQPHRAQRLRHPECGGKNQSVHTAQALPPCPRASG